MPREKKKTRIALFLYNMGGPSTTQEVPSFLTELFEDNDLLALPALPGLQSFIAEKIVRGRSREVQEKYDEIGGGSPQLRITETLCKLLEEGLQSDTFAPLREAFEFVRVAPLMRYNTPKAEMCLQQACEAGADEVWLLSQYPHCARATTGTSLREIGLLRRQNPSFAQLKLRSFAKYGSEQEFISLWQKRIDRVWKQTPGHMGKHLVVSAHNLPLSYIAEGDPYKRQIDESARRILEPLGLAEGRDWTLAWQSAVGPVKWMQPDTRDIIRKAAANGMGSILVWPIAFVSDHIETLHEIDIEFAEIAKEEGIDRFTRIENLNTDQDFVDYLLEKIHLAAEEISTHGQSLALRDLDVHPSGPGCHLQPGGCLCGKYFLSGKLGLDRGTLGKKLPASQLPMAGHAD